MIFRNHSNMLICCSRNISDYYQCWKQLCCTIFLCKPWYIWLQADVICVSSLLTQGFCSLQVRGVCCYCANKDKDPARPLAGKTGLFQSDEDMKTYICHPIVPFIELSEVSSSKRPGCGAQQIDRRFSLVWWQNFNETVFRSEGRGHRCCFRRSFDLEFTRRLSIEIKCTYDIYIHLFNPLWKRITL